MVSNTQVLRVSIDLLTKAATTKLNSFSKRISQAEKHMRMLQRQARAGVFRENFAKGARGAREFAVALVNAETKMKALAAAEKQRRESQQNQFRNMNQVLMGTGLSFLFTGMAIKNFFQSMLTSLMQTFLEVEGSTGAVNNKIDNLKAKLAFLKFNLVDAFSDSGMLDIWIERIDDLITKFDNLNPTAQADLINFALWVTVTAGAMMVLGQVMLGVLGITTLLGGGLGSIVSLFLLVAAGIFYLKTLTGSWGRAFRWLGETILIVLTSIVDVGLLPFTLILRGIVDTINSAIKAVNKLTGSKIATVELPVQLQPFGATKMQWERMTRLQAQWDAEDLAAPQSNAFLDAASALSAGSQSQNNTSNSSQITINNNVEGLITQDEFESMMGGAIDTAIKTKTDAETAFNNGSVNTG